MMCSVVEKRGRSGQLEEALCLSREKYAAVDGRQSSWHGCALYDASPIEFYFLREQEHPKLKSSGTIGPTDWPLPLPPIS